MQGRAVVDDLYHNADPHPIVVVDNRSDLSDDLGRYPGDRISCRTADLSRRDNVRDLMAGASVVVEALPPTFARGMAKIAAEVGASLVSSMYSVDPAESDPAAIARAHDDLGLINTQAEEKGICILPEFGLDPGIDLVLGAKALSEFDRVHTFNSYGTGVPAPEYATNPLKYKFSWSVIGVLRSAKRPARIVRSGQVQEIPGDQIFSPENIHSIEIEELGGALECYANGNAASYLDTFDLRNQIVEMGRYACRYPGHCAFWDRLVNSGFVDQDTVRVGDTEVSPLDFTAALLSAQDQFWFGPEEADVAMVRADVSGWSGGRPKRVVYQLIDRRDMKTGFTAMQRTVGYTMALGARMILEGQLSRCGLLSPVEVPFETFARGLEQFGMRITRHELPWDGVEQ
jgi:saccharopine dehydrogenase-like NADP-dependent oxidoreductase